jgi:Ribbon-helix-helix protein, copG family
MTNEIIKITVNTALVQLLKSLAKHRGLSVDEVMERAITFYLGSNLISQEDNLDFLSKIAEATYLK